MPSPAQDRPPATTVRAAVLDLLRAFGMTSIFGNPGSTELPLFREFPDDFRYVLGLQEAVVVGMADGYAQATRNAAFINLHSAAGVGHAMGNIFTAYRNRTPLVITAGQQARSLLPYDPFLYSNQATELPKPYVKWSVEPARAEDVPLAIARAHYVAMQPPRGRGNFSGFQGISSASDRAAPDSSAMTRCGILKLDQGGWRRFTALASVTQHVSAFGSLAMNTTLRAPISDRKYERSIVFVVAQPPAWAATARTSSASGRKRRTDNLRHGATASAPARVRPGCSTSRWCWGPPPRSERTSDRLRRRAPGPLPVPWRRS